MSTENLYNQWSSTYDTVENKTRDLEKIASQQIMSKIHFENVLELGCGTGKNTEWLSKIARHITAVDSSEAMMAKAKEKLSGQNVEFISADITIPWNFISTLPDLITCSLVLEHVADLTFIFQQANKTLKSKGYFYVCELHSYKQYGGSKARFETSEGTQVLECFVHHVSDYHEVAMKNNFSCIILNEWFDDDDRTKVPRLISFLFQKNN